MVLLELLVAEGFDDHLTRVVFFDDAIDVTKDLLPLLELGEGEFTHQEDDDEKNRQGGDASQSELPGFHEHHDDHAEEHNDVLSEGRDGGCEVLGDVIDVVRDAGKDVSELMGVKIGEGHRVYFVLNGFSQISCVIVRNRVQDEAGRVGSDR